MDAACDCWMVVEKEDLYGIWVGVDKSGFAVVLEGLRAGLPRIGNDVVSDFQAVDVGLILLITAEGASKSIGSEAENCDEQEKCRERGPIVEGTDAPGGAGAREQPADRAVSEIQKYEKYCPQERESLPDVAEGVVAHFVAKIGDDFIGRFLRDGGIPNDDALGSAEAADVGVGGDGLVAGLHPEHAVGRNFLASAARDALERSDKLWGFHSEGLKFIEHRFDDVRRDEDDEQNDGQGKNPEIEPPARWALANNGIEQPGKEGADDHGEELRFGPVTYPGRPGLNGNVVELQDPFIENIEGQLEDSDGDDQERGENERLKQAVARNFFSPVAELCGKFAAEDEPKHQEAVEKAEQDGGETNAAAVAGFAIEIGRESVGGDFIFSLRLCGG